MNNLLERIVTSPDIQHGKPCIKDSRVTVHVVLEGLSLGMTDEELKREYLISDEDIKACLGFAALLADEEEVALSSQS